MTKDYPNYTSHLTKFAGKDEIIVCPKAFVLFTGNIYAAMMLNQLLYWTPRATRKDGYIYKTYEDWQDELCIPSTFLVREARKILEDDMRIITTKRIKANGSPTIHYKIDLAYLEQAWNDWCTEDNWRILESSRLLQEWRDNGCTGKQPREQRAACYRHGTDWKNIALPDKKTAPVQVECAECDGLNVDTSQLEYQIFSHSNMQEPQFFNNRLHTEDYNITLQQTQPSTDGTATAVLDYPNGSMTSTAVELQQTFVLGMESERHTHAPAKPAKKERRKAQTTLWKEEAAQVAGKLGISFLYKDLELRTCVEAFGLLHEIKPEPGEITAAIENLIAELPTTRVFHFAKLPDVLRTYRGKKRKMVVDVPIVGRESSSVCDEWFGDVLED